MADILEGAKIVKVGEQEYILVTISKLFPGSAPPTISGLATKLSLQPEVVFTQILRNIANTHMMKKMYKDIFSAPAPASLEIARSKLIKEGNRVVLDSSSTLGNWKENHPYLSWGVQPESDKPLLFPLSNGFKNFLGKIADDRKKQERLQAIMPSLEALRTRMIAIAVKANELDHSLKIFKELGEKSGKEISVLEALKSMLNAMVYYPKEPLTSDTRTKIETVQNNLNNLLAQSYEHLLHNPPDILNLGFTTHRDTKTQELLNLINDPELLRLAELLVNNADIAPEGIYSYIYDTTRLAYTVLLLSPKGPEIANNHVIPLIDILALKPLDTATLSAPDLPIFENAVKSVTPSVPSPVKTLLSVLSAPSDLVLRTVGNAPGPPSLAITIWEQTAAWIFAKNATMKTTSHIYAGRLFRALCNLANVSSEQKIALFEAIRLRKVWKLRDINWAQRFMSSPGWGAALSVATLIIFMTSVTDDQVQTLKGLAASLSGLTGVISSLALVLQNTSTLIEKHLIEGVGGKVLGVVGGISAVIAGAAAAIDAYGAHDNAGMYIQIINTASGAIYVAGYLLSFGIVSSWTGLGVPLMTAGLLIGAGATVVSLIRSFNTSEPHDLFQKLVDFYSNSTEEPSRGISISNYRKVESTIPTLKLAFERFDASHKPGFFGGFFPYIKSDISPNLHELGFSFEQLVHITR